MKSKSTGLPNVVVRVAAVAGDLKPFLTAPFLRPPAGDSGDCFSESAGVVEDDFVEHFLVPVKRAQMVITKTYDI